MDFRSARAVYDVVLRHLACWDYGFESRPGHGRLSLLSVACFQTEVSGSGRSSARRIPTYWCVCVISVIKCYNNSVHLQCVGNKQVWPRKKERSNLIYGLMRIRFACTVILHVNIKKIENGVTVQLMMLQFSFLRWKAKYIEKTENIKCLLHARGHDYVTEGRNWACVLFETRCHPTVRIHFPSLIGKINSFPF